MSVPARILITGATGTFGNACVRHLLTLADVERICCFSRDELKQSEMAERFGHDPRLRFFLGDVRDQARLEQACYGVDAVFHAAALKRVDAVAYDSEEAVKTNILGTTNVVQAAIATGVARVVFLSSDKAVRATNFYGASKFMAEQIAVAANAYGVPRGTRIACTRYGNVLGSRGSVLHTWRQQMAAGRPITLTHPDISRFWMTAPQAVGLVLTALARMEGGEIFVPKLPALQLSALARLVGGPDHPTTLTGLRPGGEKLHEELLSGEEIARTHDGGDVYIIAPTVASWRSVAPDYGPLVDPAFRYRSDTAPVMSDAEMTLMLEAA